VRLKVSEQDGRSRVTALAPAGRAVVAKGRPLWARSQQRFASAFGKKVALDLRTALKQVAVADFGDAAPTDDGADAQNEQRKE
jgi:hypothetical protein